MSELIGIYLYWSCSSLDADFDPETGCPRNRWFLGMEKFCETLFSKHIITFTLRRMHTPCSRAVDFTITMVTTDEAREGNAVRCSVTVWAPYENYLLTVFLLCLSLRLGNSFKMEFFALHFAYVNLRTTSMRSRYSPGFSLNKLY